MAYPTKTESKMNRVLNGNPYAVLDKTVGYKEALEAITNAGAELTAEELIAVLFNHKRELVDRDIDRLEHALCIACGGEKVIRKDRWNPLNSQWEPHYVDCQECET